MRRCDEVEMSFSKTRSMTAKQKALTLRMEAFGSLAFSGERSMALRPCFVVGLPFSVPCNRLV
jgi:hypothetical protein